jgi:hypothetical protein
MKISNVRLWFCLLLVLDIILLLLQPAVSPRPEDFRASTVLTTQQLRLMEYPSAQ